MIMSMFTPKGEPHPARAVDHGHDFRPAESAPAARPPLPLRSQAVVRFDTTLHQLHPDAVRVGVDRMQHLLGWMLTLPEAEGRDALNLRMRRLDELRAMLADSDWELDEAMRARLTTLFAYVDGECDLLLDREPILGMLDDALMLELAWPAFAEEAEDYRDFSAYRNAEQPAGSAHEQRGAWIRDRLAEGALWQHMLRFHDSHYGDVRHPEGLFHVT